MSKESVLVVVTRYDAGSYYTYQWARDLQAELATMKHTCLLLDASDLCRSGSSFADAIDCAKYIVFYGHGEKDEWTALPTSRSSGKTTPLVDTNTVTILDDHQIYACCCHSLVGLGKNFGTRCKGEYVGYNNTFAFEASNHQFFRDIVNNSVIGFVKGDPRKTVVSNLKKAWEGLRDAFAGGGILQHRPNAFAASQSARDNALRIASEPP
jgi:hypothetical protein